MDPDNGQSFDENLDIDDNDNVDDIDDEELFDDEKLDNNDNDNIDANENIEKVEDDIDIDEAINENIEENIEENNKENSNEVIDKNDNKSKNEDIDMNINIDENEENENIVNDDLNESSPPEDLKIDSKSISNDNKNENNNVESENSDNIKSESNVNDSNYNRIVDIDESEVIMKPINDIKNEEKTSSDKLMGSKRSLYGSFGSNPQITKSNQELYKNIVQKRYQLGSKERENRPHSKIVEEITNEDDTENIKNDLSTTSKESIHYHLQDPLSSQSFFKKEKVKYIESNMVDSKTVDLNSLTEEEIQKKNDRWLCPLFLNNEKYKKNYEADMNNLSVQILAQEFLTNDNVDLETRAYLLESVFPILCVSLEKLLIEIDRRKIIERDEKPSEFVVEREYNAIPRDVPFDSINWLAQYLYRNNPKYSNYADVTSTPYLKSIKSVMTTLKAKLFEMEINKKALERADELARKREEERQQKIMEAMYIEKKRTYSNLLVSLYKQLVRKYWRKDKDIYLTNFEILDCLISIATNYNPTKETDDLKDKLLKLVASVTEEIESLVLIEIEKIRSIEENKIKEQNLKNTIEKNNENKIDDEQNSENYRKSEEYINSETEISNSNEEIINEDVKNDENDNNEINDNIGSHKSVDINEEKINENDTENIENNENNKSNKLLNEINADIDNNQNNIEENNHLSRATTSNSKGSNKLNIDKNLYELRIHQETFVDIILNSIIEWKIEDVSLLISLIMDYAKSEEIEMNRIFEIIFGLPGIIRLGDEWKRFIETNAVKLEMPQDFVEEEKIEDRTTTADTDASEFISTDKNEESLNGENEEENEGYAIHEVKLLELRRNIKIKNNQCTIILSDHPDNKLIKPVSDDEKNMTINIYDDKNDDVEKETFEVTSRFSKSVGDLLDHFKSDLPHIPYNYDYDYSDDENLNMTNFQMFVKELISTYSSKPVLFTLYQINCLKLMEIEEEKRQEIKRKEEEILQKRIRKMKLIFKSVDTEGTGSVLVKQLNTIFENVPTSVGDIEFLKYPLEVQDMFVYLKIPVMARALLTKTITEQEFIDHVLNVCSSLISEHFDTVLQLILDSLGIDPEKEEGFIEQKDGGDDTGNNEDNLTPREKDQNEVLKMILNLMKDPEADVSQICDLGLTWTMDTISKYNKSGLLMGDLVMNESVVDITSDGENNGEEKKEPSTQLVYISVDNTGKESIENVDKQFSILDNPKSSILEAFSSNIVKVTNCNESQSEDENKLKDSLILNVPFTGKDDQIPLGVLSLLLKPKQDEKQNTEEGSEEAKQNDQSLEFSKEDIDFIKSVGKILGYAVEHIVHRERSNAILESCSTYILDLIKNSNINLYLVEKVPSKNAIENFGKKKSKEKKEKEKENKEKVISVDDNDSDSGQSFSKEDYTYVMYVSDKPTEEEKKKISKKNNKKKTTEKNSKNKVKFQKSEKDNVLKKVSKKDRNRDVLMESVNTNTVVTRPDSEQGDETVTTIPILDQMNQCIGMISMNTKLAENDPSFIEDINELKRLATLIADAMTLAEQESKKNTKPVLYAETISEQLRRKLFFPKLLLLKARENLSKIDANSIAELKSYRVPPTIIHKIISCILYMFGYTPKQVESWQDAARYINQDLLRKMQQYDSTAKQKGTVFKRIKSIIKKYIKSNDIKKQSSLPAQCMYDWLLVSLTIRSIAIRNRKAHKEENVFASNEYEEEEEIFDDEADEEETLNYILNHQNRNTRNFRSLFNLSSKKNDDDDGKESFEKEKTIHYSFSYSRIDKFRKSNN